MHTDTESHQISSTRRKSYRRKRHSRTKTTEHTKHRHSNSTTQQSRRERYSRTKARQHPSVTCPAGYSISEELPHDCVADGYEQQAKEFNEKQDELNKREHVYLALATGTARIHKSDYECSSKPYRLEMVWRKYEGYDTMHCELGIGDERYLCLGKIKHVGEPKIDSKLPRSKHKTNYLLNQGDTTFTFEYFIDATSTVFGVYPPRQLQLTNVCLDSYEDVTSCFDYIKDRTDAWSVLDRLYSRKA